MLLGWFLTVVLLLGIVWVVPLGEVGQALLHASFPLLALATTPMLLNLWLRGVRWALLFRPHHAISARAALGPVLISLGLNAVLPGRVGEIARVTLGARKFGTSFPFTMSTVVGERLLDALTLLTFMGGALLLLPQVDASATVSVLGYSLNAEALTSMGRQLGVMSIVLIGLAVWLLSPAFHGLLPRLLSRLPRVGPKVGSWAERIFGEFSRGLTALRSPAIMAQALLLSAVIWLALAAMNLIVAQAIPGISLTVPQALVVTAISILASFLPSAPGAWGVYEAGMLLALALVHVTPEPGIGIGFALASHLCSYLPVVVLGAAAGFRSDSFRRKETPLV